MQRSWPDFGGRLPGLLLDRGVCPGQTNRANQPPGPQADDLVGELQGPWGLQLAHWVGDYSQHPQYPGSVSIYGSVTPFQQIMTFRSSFASKWVRRRGKGGRALRMLLLWLVLCQSPKEAALGVGSEAAAFSWFRPVLLL